MAELHSQWVPYYHQKQNLGLMKNHCISEEINNYIIHASNTGSNSQPKSSDWILELPEFDTVTVAIAGKQ